jgi:hypothetical protein
MPLSNALYKTQDQGERDLTEGPGWTIDEQKPGFMSNALEAIPRGIGQGAADGISVLTHGLQFGGHKSPMDAVMDGPLAAQQATQEMVTGKKTEESPWKQSWDVGAAQVEADTRDYAKSLTPDPRITGTGANIVQGFSKAVTEFSVGSAAGGPLGGATLLGASDGYAHYQDLRDAGVDEETAKKSGLLEAMTSGGSALLPMGMPAKWLKGLSTVGTLGAQAGAGAVINTSFGAASRYASAKILEDAGYPEMAEQQKPWDETNIITDALAGLFFGAHAGFHGLKVADVDPSIRDAAKTVQDRQEVNDRAPGVPVDMKSAAVHRQSLETALGDLMANKSVDLSKVDTEGATFARPEVDESQAHDIMREEFQKSGVLDEAASFDRWLAGEPQKEPKDVPTPKPEGKPEADDAFAAESADFVSTIKERGETKEPGEMAVSDHATRAVTDRPDLELPAQGRAEQTKSRLDDLMERAQKRHAMEDQGQGILDDMEERGESPRDVSREFWANTYQKLNEVNQRRFERQAKALTGFEPGSVLSVDREGNQEVARDWVHVGESIGHDLANKPEHLEGPERGYVSLMKWANDQAATRPGTERAADTLQIAKEEEAQANKEAEPMFQAAIACEARHQ